MSDSSELCRSLILFTVMFAGLLAVQPGLAQPACTITQITHSAGTGESRSPSLDGGSIAFESSADLTGDNPLGRAHIFLFDGSAIRQIVDVSGPGLFLSQPPSLDGGSVAFESAADLTGENPDQNSEIFLFDGSTINQITHSTSGDSFTPSLNLTGGNPDESPEILLFDGTGMNPNHHNEIFLASCFPAPPPGPFLTSDAIPGFRFKVRITAGAQAIAGQKEADCIGETLCVSGALPGRSELFLRIIGPRPNGFLWVTAVQNRQEPASGQGLTR